MPHSPDSPERSDARRIRVRVSVFALVLVAFGLLLWARFLLVTNHPRTAIAEPPVQTQLGTVDSHMAP